VEGISTVRFRLAVESKDNKAYNNGYDDGGKEEEKEGKYARYAKNGAGGAVGGHESVHIW
jgi:hypothetical protein